METLLLDLRLGRARLKEVGPSGLALANPNPGLLLVPWEGRFSVALPGEPPRPIHSQLWFWCGQDQAFTLGLPAEGELVWFQVPAGLPGFCPLFSHRSRTVACAAPIFPVLDLLQACRLDPELRRVALFGRSLDLLAHVFQYQQDPAPGGDDAARVAQARRILLERMTDPPTIPQLAGQSGLNECKLKALFKRTYGFTVHGFVKEQRLRRAQVLLNAGMQVSEVAWAVGWENCGHFARAFRERFGCLPSRLEQHSSGPEQRGGFE